MIWSLLLFALALYAGVWVAKKVPALGSKAK